VPIIDEVLDELGGVKWFSKMDLQAGYHQICLATREEFKTAFQTHNGQYEFTVMAFGLTGDPATFLNAMNDTLKEYLHKFVLVFFDGILIYINTYEEHLQHLTVVLQRLQEHHWQVKMTKCSFAQPSVSYLGHVISASGVATDTSKIHIVQDWPAPTNVKELRSFFGSIRILQKICAPLWCIAKPLTNLLRIGAS
jgi:hypothetical protein